LLIDQCQELEDTPNKEKELDNELKNKYLSIEYQKVVDIYLAKQYKLLVKMRKGTLTVKESRYFGLQFNKAKKGVVQYTE